MNGKPDLRRESLAYVRRRRLAVAIAVVSVVLLGAGLLLGFYPESYFSPSLAADDQGVTLLHAAIRYEEGPFSYLLHLDPKLQLDTRTLLQGLCCGRIGNRLIFPRRVASLDGPGENLEQDWNVRGAAPGRDAGSIWVFGGREKELLARRVGAEGADPEQKLAKAEDDIGEIRAFSLPDGSPAVAWRVRKGNVIRIHSLRDDGFSLFESIDLGDVRQFVPVSLGKRLLLFHQRRGDHTLRTIRIRVACCRACEEPPPRVEDIP